jgi:hypothetical protein
MRSSMPIYLLMLFLTVSKGYGYTPPDSAILMLIETIDHKDSYIKEKRERISRLENMLLEEKFSLPIQFSIYKKLHQEYKKFKFDSAFYYATKLQETAYQLQDNQKINFSKIQIGHTLLLSGLFKEAFDTVKTVLPSQLSDSLKVDYYFLMARACHDLYDFHQDFYYQSLYKQAGEQYVDSALMLLKQENIEFHALTGMLYESSHDIDKAIEAFQTILETYTLAPNDYAMACFSLGTMYYYHKWDFDKGLALIAEAAISDLKASVKEGVALMTIAKMLHEKGESDYAYKIIKQAKEDADFFGAKQRKMQVANILPVIEGKRLSDIEKQNKTFLSYAIGGSSFSTLILLLSVVIFIQLKKLKLHKKTVSQANLQLKESNELLKNTNEKLKEVNTVNEEYISYSFNVYADYLEKMEKFKNDLDRKLRDKRFDQINYTMNSFNLNKEREAIWQSFDQTFFKLFPNFINEFNGFFNKEDQFSIKENFLTPELRIFALIRMGVNDHEQIAKFLNYKVRTVYNYKNKIKSKSILSNEEFEQKLMQIRTV